MHSEIKRDRLGSNILNGNNFIVYPQNANDSTTLFCTEDFFINDAGDCKPNCNSWTMYSKTVETAALVIVGTSLVIGILTTIVIIILSFTSYKTM